MMTQKPLGGYRLPASDIHKIAQATKRCIGQGSSTSPMPALSPESNSTEICFLAFVGLHLCVSRRENVLPLIAIRDPYEKWIVQQVSAMEYSDKRGALQLRGVQLCIDQLLLMKYLGWSSTPVAFHGSFRSLIIVPLLIGRPMDHDRNWTVSPRVVDPSRDWSGRSELRGNTLKREDLELFSSWKLLHDDVGWHNLGFCPDFSVHLV